MLSVGQHTRLVRDQLPALTQLTIMTNHQPTVRGGINLTSSILAMQQALVRLDDDRTIPYYLYHQSGQGLVISWPGCAQGSFDFQRDGFYRVWSALELMDSGLGLPLGDWQKATGPDALYNHRASIILYVIDRNRQVIGLGGYTPMLSTAYVQWYSPFNGAHVETQWIDMPQWNEPEITAALIHERRDSMVLFKAFAKHHRSQPLPRLIVEQRFCP